MSAGVADLVLDAARTHPHHVALVAGERRSTWGQVNVAVDAAAAGFQNLGLARGNRVALMMSNSPDFVAAYFGALRAGLVAVPVNPTFTSTELDSILEISGARAVVFDRVGASAVRATAAPGLLRIVAGAPAAGESAFASFSGFPRSSEAGEEDLAVLLFTSGTTGRPRGAMLSHRALLASVEQVAAVTDPPAATSDDVVLVVLPLSHIYALNGTLAAAARASATVVLAERFDPFATLDLLRRHHVTNVAGAPSLYAAWADLVESDPDRFRPAFESIRLLLTGAAAMPVAVHERFAAVVGLGIHEGYGLTEAAPGVASTLVVGRLKPGAVGRPFPGVEVLLLDQDGEEVEDGDPGEIMVRGANLFSGYWPDGSGGPDENGWFATGDVAYNDVDGDLVLVGRRKELVIVSGFNVYPREVEDALGAHPDVAEVAVVGVPDPQTGEAVVAFVVPEPGAVPDPEDIMRYAGTRLARFKWPAQVRIVEELPHSDSGKIAKVRLRRDPSGPAA